jgi:hypothetical protein
MLKINLWDETFSHLQTPDGNYSMVHQKSPKTIKYVSKKTNYDGITLFTDHYLSSTYISSINSKYKIGWYIERCELNPSPKMLIDSYINKLDFLMTNDKEILQKHPNKTKFVPFGGTWIKQDNHYMHEKTKDVSMIYSNKKHKYEGYRLRHDIANRFNHNIDLYGNGSSNPVKYKEEGLVDYRYTIVIENLKRENYFTEKLVDSLAVGSIPIYWGCPNIGDFFNLDSIITFNNTIELELILNNIVSNEHYIKNINSTTSNLETSKKYAITEDWIYYNILKELKDV